MNICENQINMLQTLFEKFDSDGKGYLKENELRLLLSEFEIDENFTPLMLRLFSCTNKSQDNEEQITFENFIAFFSILFSGDMKQFMNLMFNAIDYDGNGKIGVEELIEFSSLIGDSLSNQEANQILLECSKSNNLQFFQIYQKNIGNLPNSNSSYTLSEDFKQNPPRSKSHVNFKSENPLDGINFDQLWECYS